MPAAWDSTKSYKLKDVVSYNGYDYAYINKNEDSTAGQAPDSAMFTVPGYGESVRAWTIWFPTWDQQNGQQYSDGVASSRGLPKPTISSTVPKFEQSPTIVPVAVKSDFSGNGDTVFNLPYPASSMIHEIFDRNEIIPSQFVGYNVEFKGTVNEPEFWFNASSAVGDFYFVGAVDKFIVTKSWSEAGDKAILTVTANPSSTPYISSYSQWDNAIPDGLMNMFGRNFRFKFAVKFTNKITGEKRYTEMEYGNVSTGEFRDDFLTSPNSVTIERMKPTPPAEWDSQYIFSGPPENPWEGEIVLTNRD